MYKSLSRLPLIALTGACMPLVGCIDDKYDLSDIDTTAEIRVTDLVVPVNLDEITLSNVFDLEDGSVLKEINGIYAVLVDGDFRSDEIRINSVSLPKPYIPSTSTDITLLNGGSGNIDIPAVNIGEHTIAYEIPGFNTSFEYRSDNVDKSIRAISKIEVDWTINLTLSVQNAGDVFKSISFRNLALTIPAGLHTTNYTNDNGKISLPDINLSAGSMSHTLSIHVDAIDFTRLSAQEFSFTPDQSGTNPGSLSISGNFGVGSGYVTAVPNSYISTIPSSTRMTLAPEGSAITVKSVDGTIRYGISSFNVDPVSLNDLPDLLQQEETNITLDNPRLYLSINNPMAGYSLNASSGLTLTACRENGSRDPYSLNPGQLINIGHNAGIAGPYKFCLAPDPSAAKDFAGYEDAQPVGYTGLGEVLSGSGLPSYIEVSFDDPHVGPGNVTGFTLPQTLQSIEGSYHFYAPLNLGVGSKIVYDDKTDGWSDDTIDKITIERLKVNAVVTNSLPFDIILTGYPIDVNGNQCKTASGSPVSLGEVNVKAGETTQFVLESNGAFTHIDGVRYYATAVVSKAGVTLRPDAIITVSDIKATVSGHYIDEL